MKTIPLTQGKVALIDDEDFDRVNQFKWYANWQHGNWYAIRNLPREGRKQQLKISLHIFLFPGLDQIDHIDGNGLNCQKENLRPATQSQNQFNARKKDGQCSSSYKGVCWHVRRQLWQASIYSGGNLKYLGGYNSEIEAAHAYDTAAKTYFGEFVHLNFQ